MSKACRRCGGNGVEPLEQALKSAFDEVVRTPGCSAAELLERFPGVGVTALNNRLERLRMGPGLVRREKRGRMWRYFPIGVAYCHVREIGGQLKCDPARCPRLGQDIEGCPGFVD